MMNTMLRQVVLGGTGRRADLQGFQVAGKTGTTNDYHDAWFVGFTGNYVCAVWYGNDDYASMNQMTGGTLPAATWHEIMAYAHQNAEPKPVPGLPAAPPETSAAVARSEPATMGGAARPIILSKASIEALGSIASTMHVAEIGRSSAKVNSMRESSDHNVAVSDPARAASRIINLR